MNLNYSNSLQKGQEKKHKKHNTALTSLESFAILNKTGQKLSETAIVLEAIKLHQPVTSRMLCSITKIERTSITRSLFDLVHEAPPKIKEAFIGPCPQSGRRVKHYTLINWQKSVWIQSEINW